MAKRRKQRRSRGRRKSRKGSRRSKGPGLATEAGGLVTAVRILNTNDAIPYLAKNLNIEGAKAVGKAWVQGAKKLENYAPVVGGATIHWAKNKPIVRIVLKPIDNLVKKYVSRQGL